jgi:enamine deaminase RidA (YjgF/YER057c/UK114 family)
METTMNEGELGAGLAQTPNYRYADHVGDRLFVAGQVPRDGAANLVAPGDPVVQTRQCLDNLFTLIDHHGFSRDDIHQLTVYVVGPQQNLKDAWIEVTARFDSNVPPATLLGVNLLGYVDQVVEIDAVIQRMP